MKSVLEVFKVASDSSPDKTYTVTEYDNGEWACGCVGWTRHVPRKDCKHIRWAKMGGALAMDPLARAVEVALHKAEARAK